jgi:RecA/RadA recombinase
MIPAERLDRLTAARRALAEASSAAGVALVRGESRRGAVIETGIAAIDGALGGGLPRGRIVEIVGPRSSGRLSLTLALLHRALHTGEPAAFIDAADALDPRALDPADRARVLWIRPRDALTALQCADLLLDGGGFGVIAIYLVGVARALERDQERARQHALRPRDPAHTTDDRVRVTRQRAIGSGAWARLAQRAEKVRSSLVVTVDPESSHAPGAFAFASLALNAGTTHWRSHALLDGVQCRVAVRKQKLGAHTATANEVLLRAG